ARLLSLSSHETISFRTTRRPTIPTLFPYTTLFRSHRGRIVPTMLAAVAKVGIKERTARLAARADAQAGIWEPASRAAPAPAKRTRPHKPHCAKARLYRGCTARSGAT